MRTLLWSLGPAFAVMWAMAMALLFYLYVSPHTPPSHVMIESMGIGMDKLSHVFVHAGLLAMPLALVPDKRLAWFMAWLAIAAGVGFDFTQLFVPERRFDLADLTANIAGLVIGARGGRLIRELQLRRA